MKIMLDTTKRKARIEEEIRERYAKFMAAVASPYKQVERETWFSQIQEADAWLISASVETPLISALAQARGIPLPLLVEKIKENDTLFRAAIGGLLGKQQAELDELYS